MSDNPGNELSRYIPHKALVAGKASIVVVMILIALKTVMYILSDSASVLASLMDSMADATVSVMTFFAIRFSLKPADDNHRSGHGKIEGLAALSGISHNAGRARLAMGSFAPLHSSAPCRIS